MFSIFSSLQVIIVLMIDKIRYTTADDLDSAVKNDLTLSSNVGVIFVVGLTFEEIFPIMLTIVDSSSKPKPKYL